MNERLHEEKLKPIDQLQPGEIYPIPNSGKLAAFEDLVAQQLQPDMTVLEERGWNGRKMLRDLICPDKFLGSIQNIRVEIIEEPYEKLFNAKERGKTFQSVLGLPRKRSDECNEHYEQLTKGYLLTADEKKSGKGVVGQIQVELYYVPPPNRSAVGYNKTNVHSNSGGINRYATRPEEIIIEKLKSPKENSNSRVVGKVALRQHPLVNADQRTIK